MIDQMPGDIFTAGQILNNTYEILGVLGRGGTGEVYLARNQIVGRQVAIKALNSQFSDNEDYLELMKREEEMRDIVHDAVVRYSECSRSDQGHVFLVMEFVDGVSLNDLMMDRRLEERELLIIAHRVLEGLVPVHAHQIVHRDLSPDNIILRDGDPERATIIDFGIAKDSSTGARTIVGNDFAGKYEYAAPEQLDGHSEYRTDLYALGASILAAYRRDIPFLGATPGEIIRRKQEPLDTDGVREPLKTFIEWLAAPDLNDRPADASEALHRLKTEFLKVPTAKTRRSRRQQTQKKRGLVWLAVPVVAVVAGVGLWASGLLSSLFDTPLQTVSPYTLTARLDADATAELQGYAPNSEAQLAMIAAFVDATGANDAETDVFLADGLPSPEWPSKMQALMAMTGGLEKWLLEVEDTNARLTGMAPSTAAREQLKEKLASWSATNGISVTPDLIAGPALLSVADVGQMLGGLGTCGPLAVAQDPAQAFELYDTITLTGNLASAEDEAGILNALQPQIGDRKLRMETVALNEDLCTIRNVLPPVDSANLSIWLGEGSRSEPVLTGVYKTNENPVVEVHLPATIDQGSLWVMIVDNTGKVFHILPNVNDGEHGIANLGALENGVRKVRVLHSADEFRADRSKIAMQVDKSSYGKSEVIAVLSRSKLFDLRRPRDESVTSVAEALTEAFTGREDEIIGVASRIIDARP